MKILLEINRERYLLRGARYTGERYFIIKTSDENLYESKWGGLVTQALCVREAGDKPKDLAPINSTGIHCWKQVSKNYNIVEGK